VALRLRALGIQRVRPLAGGFPGWREKGYPLVAIDFGEPKPAPKHAAV